MVLSYYCCLRVTNSHMQINEVSGYRRRHSTINDEAEAEQTIPADLQMQESMSLSFITIRSFHAFPSKTSQVTSLLRGPCFHSADEHDSLFSKEYPIRLKPGPLRLSHIS